MILIRLSTALHGFDAGPARGRSGEVKSWTVDYLTCTQLAEYYEKYNDCPIEGFSCAAIHFYRLARNRCARYTEYRNQVYDAHLNTYNITYVIEYLMEIPEISFYSEFALCGFGSFFEPCSHTKKLTVDSRLVRNQSMLC